MQMKQQVSNAQAQAAAQAAAVAGNVSVPQGMGGKLLPQPDPSPLVRSLNLH